MRDRLSDFGVAKTAASSADTEFPNGLDAGDGGNLGRLCEQRIHVKVEGSKAVGESEVLTFTVKHKDDTGAGTTLATIARPAGALPVGGDYVFRIPLEHKRYISLSVKSSATADISLHAYLEEGDGK